MRAMELYRGLGHQAELEGNEKRLQQLQLSLVLFVADSYITCRSHAAPLPCSDTAWSFVNVSMVAGNIRTASPTVTGRLFCSVLLPHFSSSMTNGVWFHTGYLHLRLVCV
jgi:hypothetical protein